MLFDTTYFEILSMQIRDIKYVNMDLSTMLKTILSLYINYLKLYLILFSVFVVYNIKPRKQLYNKSSIIKITPEYLIIKVVYINRKISYSDFILT